MLATAPGSPDVWAVYNEYDHKTRASVAEWTGKAWAHPTVFPVGTNSRGSPPRAPPSGPSAPGRSSAIPRTWSASPASPGRRRPRQAGLRPLDPRRPFANDIWAQSLASKGIGIQFSHWNGTRWAKQSVPPAPKGAPGAYGGLSGDLAVSGTQRMGLRLLRVQDRRYRLLASALEREGLVQRQGPVPAQPDVHRRPAGPRRPRRRLARGQPPQARPRVPLPRHRRRPVVPGGDTHTQGKYGT